MDLNLFPAMINSSIDPFYIFTGSLNQSVPQLATYDTEMAPRVRLSNTTTVSQVFLKACEEEDLEKVRACLTLGVDINCRDSDNHTPLYYSLFSSDPKIFNLLIEQSLNQHFS